MNNHQSSVETRHAASLHDASLQEAWNRFVDDTYTLEDLALILDSVRNDDNLAVFYNVLKKIGDDASSITPPTREQKEAYRKEACRIYAEYMRNGEPRIKPVSLRNNLSRFRRTWYAAAAVLLLGLLIPAASIFLKPKVEQTLVQYVEKVTVRGDIETIILPDQTEVMLNAGSRLKYPVQFNGDERSVELYGEALFNVTSDPARAFTVKTENMNIKVVGTVFNVKEYADDIFSTVSVASGKVKVETRCAASAIPEQNRETGSVSSIMLEQNQQLKMDKATGNFEKLTIEADKILSWTDGTLYFQRTPIREVINMLNRQYPQVNIELAEGEYADLISGKHKNIYPIEDILKTITFSTGLKCTKTGENKYTLYK